MLTRIRRILSILLIFCFVFEQTSFAQIAGQLNISGFLSSLSQSFTQSDKFRPVHLRYLAYNQKDNTFKLLLDKGSQEEIPSKSQANELEDQTKTLFQYFLIGLSLPNDYFWVNLRPDSPDNIIDRQLAQTDIGRVMLEADLQLKKDTALATSPQTPEGKLYWDKLYKKAGELFGNENITIPTLTRPWIVPNEIIIRETADSAYIYKATLKVMLESDYLKACKSPITSTDYTFKDPRLKVLNEYSSQLIRELIIPKLNKEINSSKKYASLRQVYYSLILAQWFKARFQGKNTDYANFIDRKILTNLTSRSSYSKDAYFKAYQESFRDGEYNIQEPTYTSAGRVIRSYFSGGMVLDIRMSVTGQPAAIDSQAGNITALPAVGEPVTVNRRNFLSFMAVALTGLPFVWAAENKPVAAGETTKATSAEQDKINALLRDLEDPDPRVRKVAIIALEKIKYPKLADVLIKALTDADADVRWETTRILASLRDPGTVDALIKALSDPEARIRWAAALCLGEIKDKKAVDPLVKLLAEDKNTNVRAKAAESLGKIGDARAIEALIKALTSDVRVEISDPIELVEALAKALSEEGKKEYKEYKEFIRKIIEALVKLKSIEGLLRALSDRNLTIQEVAVGVLKNINVADFVGANQIDRDFITCLVARRNDIVAQALSPYSLYLIYRDQGFLRATQGMHKIHRFTIARGIENILSRYNQDVNSRNINIVLPFVLKGWNDLGQHLVINKRSRVIAAFHEEARFNMGRFTKFMQQFGIKVNDPAVFCAFKGSLKPGLLGQAKNGLRERIRDPNYSLFWFEGHGGLRHIWFASGQPGKEESDDLHRPNALSYKELAEDLLTRAIRNRGRLSDFTIVLDSCYSADFVVNTLNELARFISSGQIRDLPKIITSTNRGTLSYSLYDLVVSPGDNRELELRDKDLQQLTVSSRNNKELELRGKDFYQFEIWQWNRQERGFFLPISSEELLRLKKALGLSETNSSSLVIDAEKQGIPRAPERWMVPLEPDIPILNVQVPLQPRPPFSFTTVAGSPEQLVSLSGLSYFGTAAGRGNVRLPPYTGAGDTAIHTALADAERKIAIGDRAGARELLEDLIRDLRSAQAAGDIEPLMDKWNSRYSGSDVDLMIDDIPKAIHDAEELLARLSKRDELGRDDDVDSVWAVSEAEAGEAEARFNEILAEVGVKPAAFQITGKGLFGDSVSRVGIPDLVQALGIPGNSSAVILDAGSGQGSLLIRLAMLNPHIRVAGIEYDDALFADSEKVLAAAEARQLVAKGQVRFYHGDFNAEEYGELFQQADVIYYYGFGTSDEEEFARTLIRNMKPGARLVVLRKVSGVARPLQASGLFKVQEGPSISIAWRRQKAVDNPGGIDFRSMLIVAQAMANLGIAPAAMGRLNNLDLSSEWSGIEKLADSGMTPSAERIKEYVQAACLKGDLSKDRVITCIAHILKQQEEECVLTDPVLKDILVVLEASSNQQLKDIFTKKG